MAGVTPGSGKGLDALTRRVSDLERIMRGMSPTRILAKISRNTNQSLEVMARTSGGAPPDASPAPFYLSRGPDGAEIRYGVLLASVNLIEFNTMTITVDVSEYKVNSFIYQGPVNGLVTHVPSNLDPDRAESTELKWFGKVYLAWDCDASGVISNVRIEGPDEPDEERIPAINTLLEREDKIGKYFVEIGEVPEDGDVIQNVSGNITWCVTFVGSSSAGP